MARNIVFRICLSNFVFQLLPLVFGNLISWSNGGDDVGSEEKMEATIHKSGHICHDCRNHGEGEASASIHIAQIVEGEIDEEWY